MKKLLIILFMPLISMAQLQQTYVPDDNFEAALEYMGIGNGILNDNYVTTANISDVMSINLEFQGISDLTGIEDFQSLYGLRVNDNNLTSIDVSNNIALERLSLTNNQLTTLDVTNNINLDLLWCNGNQLTSLNIRNGNNISLELFNSLDNPDLTCISSDPGYSTGMFISIDSQQYFSDSPCTTTEVIYSDMYQNRKLVRVVDLFGREVINYNQVVFLIYDDGSVERRVIIQ